MKILLDTSVLVAAMVESHPEHERAFPWLKCIVDRKDQGFVSTHSIAELYNVLTVLPVRPRIAPDSARDLIVSNLRNFKAVSLDTADYFAVIESLSSLGIVGGATFDALIIQAAGFAEVDRIVTLNLRDFHRVSPGMADIIVAP